ncbi:MAG: transposase, partial [Fibrella sp.]|nr:transposase [Armatimonadota bacterium]
VLEQVIEEEMTEHIGARHREKTDTRTGERNGSYNRGLITPVGKIEQLRVPRDREGTFTTEVFEKYHRSTGEVEDAVLEMWLQRTTRKVASGNFRKPEKDRRSHAKIRCCKDWQGRG